MESFISDMDVSFKKCRDYSKHYTLSEKPPKRGDPNGDCYVIPFILHGYYAKYLQPWINSYGGEAGNLLIIDFNEFESDGQKVMNDIAKFLYIEPLEFKVGSVFNSRENRGVHAKSHSTGGAISAISKSEVSLESWTNELPEATYNALFAYYEEPNRQLKKMLDDEGVSMTWLDVALKQSEDKAAGINPNTQ
jgi:rRNA maturation protein Nop10